jgi:hypothetical protein
MKEQGLPAFDPVFGYMQKAFLCSSNVCPFLAETLVFKRSLQNADKNS